MNRNKELQRVLSLLCALVMVIGMLPIPALASENEEPEQNPWNGRSAVFVGDSITAGTGTTKIYYEYLKETFGFRSVTAMGVAGSCISAASDYGQSNQPLINRYQNIPSADLIVIFMGTNDYGHETPLGSATDTQDGTFYGALNVIIPALVDKHTASKILFVTPMHRYGFGTSKILGTQFTSDDLPNGVGAALGDYVDALKTVCAKNGVSVIDLYTECTLDPSDTSVRSAYMPDGLHPNAAGHEVIAGIMESHLRNDSPVEKAPETETQPEEETELIYGNKFASGFDQHNRASSRVNLYLKAGTIITLKDPDAMQWACTKTNGASSCDNLGYFPDSAWSDKETAVVEADGWVGFVFKYRDETEVFDLTKPLSDYITIEETHNHIYENGICIGCGENKPEIPYDQLSTVWPSVNTDLTHIICYGQSFSTGSDAPYYNDPTVENVYVYGGITNSGNGTELKHLTASAGNQHPIISAGNVLAKLLTAAGIDTDIVLGSYGSGGKTIAQLMSAQRQAEIKEEEGYTYDILSSGRYTIFQNSVSALAQYAEKNEQSISCPVIVYLQGETDQNTDAQLGYPDNPARAGYGAGGDKEKYKEYMSRLKEDMQREVMKQYGQTEKPLFVIYQVSGTYTRTDYSSINMAQLEFAQENEDVILVQTPYFTSHYTNSHHLTQNGYRWLGEYIARYIYTALVEREKPWPMLPASFAVEGGNVVRISISGAKNGLSIDTYTVEDATDNRNLYGFYLEVDGTLVKPADVTVSGSEITLTLPENVDLRTAAKVYLIYAGRRAKGTGNIRDNCTELGFYEYLDDTNDTGTGNNQGVSHSALDSDGNSIIGQKYPLYNWLASFCYEVEVPDAEQRQGAFYHWEMQESGLVSITEGNATQNNLTLLEGSVDGGVLNKVQYSMEKTIVLEHDRPWVIEWKAAGNGNSYGGGKFLSVSGDKDSHAQYLYLPADSRGMVAWGVGSDSANYGFQLGKQGIDIRKEHTYRIENRIADDGVNTVYLIVDGIEIGAMNTGYRTSANSSGTAGSMIAEPKNWANGKNIYMNRIGSGGSFLLKNLKLSYLKVWENGPAHTHAYESVVTAPTCTEKGYTTYACECGDSYVADYVNASGHAYENGICIGCGMVQEGCVWQTVKNGQLVGAYAELQDAVDACADGDTIVLTGNSAAVSGAVVEKDIAIDGHKHLVDISGCSNAFITVAEGAKVTIRDLALDGGADGFEVDYDAVSYTNYTIPLVSGSLDNDPKASKSAIVSSGSLICENVDISNCYAASYGGAMQILAGSAALTDCDFKHNYGTTYGGALYIGSKFGTRTECPVTAVSITDCTFADNYSGHGGGIYAFNCKEMTVSGTVFDSNTANGGKGGAIDLATENTTNPAGKALGLDYMQTTIDACSFTNNWAGNDGFAIQSYDSELYITSCDFVGNVGVHPTSSVGTVSVEHYRGEDWRLYTKLEDCLFEGNIGPCSCYGDHSSPSDLDVIGCEFRGNSGRNSFLLYAAVSHIRDCTFADETVSFAVIDARIYENYGVAPSLTLTDVTIDGTTGPADILVRKQNHNDSLNDYTVTLTGVTSGDIAIWDGNDVIVKGSHTGDVNLDDSTKERDLTVAAGAVLNGSVALHPDTYTVIFSCADETETVEHRFLYLQQDKIYVPSELGVPITQGKRLTVYQDSGMTKLWDGTLSGDTELYGRLSAELEHDMGRWNIAVEASCTKAGSKRRDCNHCDYFETEVMTALGHRYENGVCTGCGDTFAGKAVSILSHSASTYAGVSNNTAANSTIGNHDIYYTEGRHDVYLKDTWWQQTIDALGMELLVNNSWSGSCVFMPRKGASSVGYGDRAVNLHNDHTGEEPDIIFVYLGCNDFAYYKDTFGKAADVDYAALIQDHGDGTYTYAVPATTCEAYAIMLHKVKNRYPHAQIYCMTSTARRDPDYADNYADTGQPTEYSAELKKVAESFGFPVIDLESCIPKEAELFDRYMGDKRAHPNALGMDKITNEVLSVMLGADAEIRHVTSEAGIVAEQAVLLGGSYRAKTELREGYTIVVTMDGKDVTDEVYRDGMIAIEKVTGDIVIHATVQRKPMNFRWEVEDDKLESVGDAENALRKLAGTVTDGVLDQTRYQLATAVVLKHDLLWEVEWQCAGDWRGCVFTSDPAQNTKGMLYLSRTVGGQLSFGTWTGQQYDNYGVDLSRLDDQVHTYRLVNRISADGSNMVWAYVDGEEIGPMNHYYIGSKDQGKTSDWISGKDFVFSYISMEGHALRDCRLDYLQVQECVHAYENGLCTVCGDLLETITHKQWTMSLDSVAFLNYYVNPVGFAEDVDFGKQGGVVIWTGDTMPTKASQLQVGLEDCTVIEGMLHNDNGWYVRSHEIFAKNLGDMVYMRPYVEVSEGMYVYGPAKGYSPERYCQDMLKNEKERYDTRRLCAALLEYGAAAQLYFDYKVDDLVNDGLDLIDKYELSFDSSYLNGLNVTDHARSLVSTLDGEKKGVTYKKATLNLQGAIRMSVGYDISLDWTQVEKAEVLFWTEDQIAKVDSLAYELQNYSYKHDLRPKTAADTVELGDYRSLSDHILAKNLGKTMFYCCRIEMKDGSVYRSGLNAYSPEAFLSDHLKTATGEIGDLCRMIAVYGEMARQRFS